MSSSAEDRSHHRRGPVGLAAAAHALEHGMRPVVLEAGETGRACRPPMVARAHVLPLVLQR